jgi:hypothetical protein
MFACWMRCLLSARVGLGYTNTAIGWLDEAGVGCMLYVC